MFKQLFLPILAVVAFIILVGFLTQKSQNGTFNLLNSPSPTPMLNEITIGSAKVKVEVAKNEAERQKGLSGRKSLDNDRGMLFVFEKATSAVFWMKDTKIPLDLIWIKDGKVIKIDKGVQPEPGVSDDKLTRYYSNDPIDYVLEVNAGFSDKNGVEIGNSVNISL